MSKKPLIERMQDAHDAEVMEFEDAGLPLVPGVVSPEDVPAPHKDVYPDNCMHSHTDKINGFCKHK